MATKYRRYHPRKWAGVYVYELEERLGTTPDMCFFINYRNGRRLIWEKVGKLSEGYSPQVAAEIRGERLKSLRHGEKVKTAKELRLEQIEGNKTFQELAAIYFDVKGPTLKGIVTDQNRYAKHLAPLLDSKRVSDITPQHIEELRKAMAAHKPGTVWNALELMRRIINFGFKTNRCPSLSFQIEMPAKDNERVEYLKEDEVERFLAVLKNWPAQDVANMLLLALYTGMRRGEIFKLQTHDVDFDMRLINIRSPKGGKSTTIPLSTVAGNIIKEQLAWRAEHQPESPYLFPGKRGEMRVDCSAVDRIKQEAKLPAGFRSFHGLRHHFAVRLANSGEFNLDTISHLLTHKNADFTKKKYAQFLPEYLNKASERAADILSPKKK